MNFDSFKKLDFTKVLAIVASVLGIVYTFNQLYISFVSSFDSNLKTTGECYFFNVPDICDFTITQDSKFTCLDSIYPLIYRRNDSYYDTDINFRKRSVNNDARLNHIFSISKNNIGKDLKSKLLELNSIWIFKIRNTGNKTLEEIYLELPFDGYYHSRFIGDGFEKGYFNNKILLHDLRASNEIEVIVWGDGKEGENNLHIYQEKTRITHKDGVFPIEYPVSDNGFLRFNKRYNNIPVLFSICMIGLSIYFSYQAGRRNIFRVSRRSTSEEHT
jgi:hypothetical protein